MSDRGDVDVEEYFNNLVFYYTLVKQLIFNHQYFWCNRLDVDFVAVGVLKYTEIFYKNGGFLYTKNNLKTFNDNSTNSQKNNYETVVVTTFILY